LGNWAKTMIKEHLAQAVPYPGTRVITWYNHELKHQYPAQGQTYGLSHGNNTISQHRDETVAHP
jgi:hypothetical protein